MTPPHHAGADDLSSEDEIYGLDIPGQESDDEQEDYDEDELLGEEDDDDEDADHVSSKPVAEEPRGRFAKAANPAQDVLSDASEDEEEEDAVNSSDEEETWAAGSYHASRRAPGEADSSDDEALELEAEEARRLQKKARQAMAGEDFGLGAEDDESLEDLRAAARGKGRLEDSSDGDVAPRPDSDTKKEWTEEQAIAHLLQKSPETLALLDDFTATAERIKSVEKNLIVVRAGDEDGKEHPALAIMELEHREPALGC